MKKVYSYSIFISLFLNIFCIFSGIIYLIVPSNSHYWNFNGVLFVIAILYSSIVILIQGRILNPLNEKVSKYRIASYGFYAFIGFAYLLMFISNFVGFGPRLASNIGLGIMVVIGYFGILIYSSVLMFFFLSKFQKDSEYFEFEVSADRNRTIKNKILLVLRRFVVAFSFLVFSFGVLIDIAIINPRILRSLGFGLGVFAAQTGLFIGLGCITCTFLILYTLRKQNKFLKTKLLTISFLGVVVSSICFIPLLSTPSFSINAYRDFSDAYNPYFGGSWENEIETSGYSEFFLKNPFQLTGYFLGSGVPSCTIISDILYFDGSSSNYSVDQNIKLYFDAYLPPNEGIGLPGENSTIIRIHGGGWVLGDKGFMNIRMMNRYLAAQGYCVFDIQYGLNNISDIMGGFSAGPENVFGNFTLDDMMRHIGNFTHFLEAHSSEYGANLNSVFISGGSAGGQLTCAVALGLDSGNYTETFSNAYTIKGLVPYYPANNISADFASTSKLEWRDPNLLVKSDSPPSLVFQGDKDGLIEESLIFQKTYSDLGRTDCAVLLFSFGGHGCDFYFPGYYNQVFLYYMERFLFLYH